MLSLSTEALRAAGLSNNKAASVRDLAQKVLDGDVVLNSADWRARATKAYISEIQCNGISRWNVEMCLMFSCAARCLARRRHRSAVKGFGVAWEIPMPTPKELTALGEPYRPYRSVLSWYCWRAAELDV